PSGNPDNKPVTLDLGFTCLDGIVDHAIYPWLIMHRTPSGGLKELDDDNDGTCPPGDIPNDGVNDRVPIALDHGFVSLAVGESIDVKAELRYTGYGVLLEEGEEYCLNFRGTGLKWWTFGSLKVRGGVSSSWTVGEESWGTYAALGNADVEVWLDEKGVSLWFERTSVLEVFRRPRRRRQSKSAKDVKKLISTRPPSVAPITAPMLAWEADAEEEGAVAALLVGSTVAEGESPGQTLPVTSKYRSGRKLAGLRSPELHPLMHAALASTQHPTKREPKPQATQEPPSGQLGWKTCRANSVAMVEVDRLESWCRAGTVFLENFQSEREKKCNKLDRVLRAGTGKA
ncbi:MAG: hypothetical protein Q9180_002021, partial [Flavoplaca navasiana]